MPDAFLFLFFFKVRRHFRGSADFRSGWKFEVDADRKGFSPAPGATHSLWSLHTETC